MFDSAHFVKPHFASAHYIKAGTGLFLITIDGVGALDYLAPSTLNISQNINNRSTASFTLVGLAGYQPEIGQEVIISQSPCDLINFKRQFAGHIKDIQSLNSNCGKTVFHKVTCVDYNALLDRRLVANIYIAQPVADIIQAINEDFLKDEGITLNHVDTQNLTLEKAVWGYQKVSKVFNDISTATGLFWYIDFYKDLHFFLRSTQNTGAVLEPNCSSNQSNEIDPFCAFINSESCNKGIKSGKIMVDKRSDQLVNDQYIIGGYAETDVRTENFMGDGERKTFSLKYNVSTPERDDMGIVAGAIKVNGVDQTICNRDSANALLFQWYYSKGERTITQRDADATLILGDVLEVTYIGLYHVIKNSRSQASISKFKLIESTSGIYQDVLSDDSIESGQYAQKMADGLVKKFGYPSIIIKFETDSLVLDLGEIISVKLDDHNIDSPNGFNVNSIHITDVDGIVKRYVYELNNTNNSEGWQEFFRKIEYFGRKLKINQEQKIIVGNTTPEGILVTQIFTQALGIGTLQTQDVIYERMAMVSGGRNLVNYSFCGVPEVKRLNLV